MKFAIVDYVLEGRFATFNVLPSGQSGVRVRIPVYLTDEATEETVREAVQRSLHEWIAGEQGRAALCSSFVGQVIAVQE